MSEHKGYAPSMDELRQGYVYGAAPLPAYYSKDHPVARQVYGEQFDRAIAAHDKALRRKWVQEATEDVIAHDEALDKALREQIAQKIEVEMRRHDNAQIGFSAVGDAYAHAARIAREEGSE